MAVEQLTFTDVPAGKGLDTPQPGYQITGCSAGLTTELRPALRGICMHYGDSVYRLAPRASLERETAWRKTTTAVSEVPADVLTAFPAVWSYDRLGEHAYALTHVRYAGLTHDGRFGNFFARCMVFDPAERRGDECNTLALTRSDAFRSDGAHMPVLETLSNFGAGLAAEPGPGAALLRQAEYSARLPALIAALIAAPSGRPVLVCLKEWQSAGPMLEALLHLLPPYARSRTTFCTYETDRAWVLPTADGSRPADAVAAHHVIVTCHPDGRPLDLRPDEYRSLFAVFNFVENQFSDLGTPGAYAALAAASLADGRHTERLAWLHTLIDRLGVEREPAAWDSLVPVVDVMGGTASMETIADAARVCSSLATTPAQARAALDLLAPHIGRLANAPDPAAIESVAPATATLIDRLTSDAREELLPKWVAFASAALAAGRGRSAAALIAGTAKAGPQVLAAALSEAARAPAVARSTDQKDRAAFVELLLDGLGLPDTAGSTPQRWLLTTLCEAAREAGMSAAVWKRIGATHIELCLADPWDANKLALALELRRSFPADAAPEANAALNMRLLVATNPQGDELTARLKELARSACQTPELLSLGSELLQTVKSRVTDAVQRVVLIGEMADAAGGTGAGRQFTDAYLEAQAALDDDQRLRVRRTLASHGAARLLSAELSTDLANWDGEAPKGFQSWWEGALKQPQVFAQVCADVAGRLATASDAERALPLAEALLRKNGARAEGGAGVAALWDAVAATVPLDNPSDRLQVLGATPAGASPDAVRRITVVKLLADIERKAKGPGFELAQFPYKDPAWAVVQQLAAAERAQVIARAIDALSVAGVVSAADFDAFVHFLAAAGHSSDNDLAAALAQLTRGRDPVTCVLVAMHLVRGVGGGSRSPARYGPVLRTLLNSWDRGTTRLLEQHLALRFGRRDAKEESRFVDLCQAAGLRAPAAPDPAASSAAGRPAPADAGLLDKMKTRVRQFWQ